VLHFVKGRSTRADPTGRRVGPTRRPVRSVPALRGPIKLVVRENGPVCDNYTVIMMINVTVGW